MLSAVQFGYLNLVEHFIQTNEGDETEIACGFLLARRQNKVEICEYILYHSDSPQSSIDNAFTTAAEKGQLELVEIILPKATERQIIWGFRLAIANHQQPVIDFITASGKITDLEILKEAL